jgi:hypothetical protein
MLANCKIWRATEKLDGSNHQIYWDGHKLTLGGRTPDSKLPMEGVVCSPEVEMKDSNGDRIIVKIKGRDFVPGFDKILKQYKVS